MSEDYIVERFECDVKMDELRENFINAPKTREACSFCRCFNNNWSCPPFTENQT